MNFSEWMKSVPLADGSKLADGSVNNYVGAIEGRLTDWAFKHGLTPKKIMDIHDLSEFVALVEKLKQTEEYEKLNVKGHGMYGAALNKYQKYLQALGSDSDTQIGEFGPYHEQLEQIESEPSESFNPHGQEDARDRVLREVVQRRGQRKFRQSLLAAYAGCCAITGCPVIPLLEAAHITPYLGPDTNSITNGLLLRADLHTLWDIWD